MKKWQESRNYRRIKDKNGTVIANIITVDGVNVEVSEEVFLAYSQADRHERYLLEIASAGQLASLEKLEEDRNQSNHTEAMSTPSAEERYLEQEDDQIWGDRLQLLPTVLESLAPDEQELIRALYFDGLSVREYARKLGIYHRAVIYRRDKILEKLRGKFL